MQEGEDVWPPALIRAFAEDSLCKGMDLGAVVEVGGEP